MGIIHHTPNDPIKLKIADFCVPVSESGRFNVVFKDVLDAATVTGVSREDIITACTTNKAIGGSKFSWPTLDTVSTLFPNYRVVHHPLAPAVARPTTVHVHTPGRYGQRVDLDYRTMTAARTVWGIDKRSFEAIVSRSAGWQKLCPPAVVGITVHDPGWHPPKGREFTALGPARGEAVPPAFECRQNKSSVSIAYVGDKMVSSVRDVPGYVLSNCIWKGV